MFEDKEKNEFEGEYYDMTVEEDVSLEEELKDTGREMKQGAKKAADKTKKAATKTVDKVKQAGRAAKNELVE